MKVRRFAGTLCFLTKLDANDSALPEYILEDEDITVWLDVLWIWCRQVLALAQKGPSMCWRTSANDG